MEFTKEEASEVVGIVDDNGTSGLRGMFGLLENEGK
jgi:hypothetical protein